MTQIRLGEYAEIDSRNLRRFEHGEMQPTAETLARIASVLEFPVAFFSASDDLPEFTQEHASFRSLSNMTKTQAEAAVSAGALAVKLAEVLERTLQLPDVDLPSLADLAPAQAAQSLREQWGLGNKPVPNMIHQLESRGVRVFSLVEDCREVDAFCLRWKSIPFVFLNTMKSSEHSRFDAAHELGHLTLHQACTAHGKEIEQEAHQFSAAFLMPEADVIANVRGVVTLEMIFSLKHRWGVSAVALTRRLFDLRLINEYQYRQFCILYSTRGYRKNEPFPIAHEQSLLLRKAFDLLKEDGVSRSAIAAEIGVTTHELDRMVFGLMLVSVANESPQPSSPIERSLRRIK
jgi:Zn-dependent peptidase ImmA (M78 family)